MRKSVAEKIRKEVMIVGQVIEAGAECSQGKGRKGEEPGGGRVKFRRETQGGASALVSREHALRPAPPTRTPTGGFQSFWEAPWEIRRASVHSPTTLLCPISFRSTTRPTSG